MSVVSGAFADVLAGEGGGGVLRLPRPMQCSARDCPALPWLSLPSPPLPCPALPCPGLPPPPPHVRDRRIVSSQVLCKVRMLHWWGNFHRPKTELRQVDVRQILSPFPDHLNTFIGFFVHSVVTLPRPRTAARQKKGFLLGKHGKYFAGVSATSSPPPLPPPSRTPPRARAIRRPPVPCARAHTHTPAP